MQGFSAIHDANLSAALIESSGSTVVVLGTGGTIAGTASSSAENVGYTSARLGVDALVRSVPPLAQVAIETEQIVQLDSKNMSHAAWRQLALRAAHVLERADVAGVVVTHGTDTLEETAYFLHRVLAPIKPVVLTAAMRPATSLQADGPQNLLDAVTLARAPGAQGVLVVLNGSVWSGTEVRKSHTYRLDAFTAGDWGPLARVEEGQLRRLRTWPAGTPLSLDVLSDPERHPWPRVDIVTSHAGADGRIVDALIGDGVHGIVVAATGNATIHVDLEAALLRAMARGVAVLATSRVPAGPLTPGAPRAVPVANGLTPAQARVDLVLSLLAGNAAVATNRAPG